MHKKQKIRLIFSIPFILIITIFLVSIILYQKKASNIKIRIPSTPITVSNYNMEPYIVNKDYDNDGDIDEVHYAGIKSSDTLATTIQINEIDYESHYVLFNNINIKFTLKGTCIYDKNNTKDYFHIYYRIKNSSNIIVKTGSFSIDPLTNKDTFEVEFNFNDIWELKSGLHNINPNEEYTLSFS